MSAVRVEFAARMGGSTKLITGLVCIVLGGVLILGLTSHFDPPAARWMMILSPIVVLAGTALFMVRGYAIEGQSLIVKRLGWETSISLQGLNTVDMDPHTMRGAIRYFGNGGLFCFCGRFWSRALGNFRAYVTDLSSTLVLGWPDKKILISPAQTDAFLNELQRRRLI